MDVEGQTNEHDMKVYVVEGSTSFTQRWIQVFKHSPVIDFKKVALIDCPSKTLSSSWTSFCSEE